MGAWYTIGILVGIGAAIGVAAAAALRNALAALVLGVIGGVAVGIGLEHVAQAIGGGIGGACGSLGAMPLVAGALRRGGTRAGTALLVVGAAVVLAALAFVPGLGYLEAAAVPALGLRLRRRAPDRHAGLRTLARD
ncbi:MAG TPA: hypothetical protein VFA19_11495 [Gaiellaceae bacterium]|nr:hypothetical protein [Gaiellaceae bacterium]